MADPEKTKVLLELISMSDDVRSEMQTSEESVNLANEIAMPADMFGTEFTQSLFSSADDRGTVQQIFMTGATGFLGAYVYTICWKRIPHWKSAAWCAASVVTAASAASAATHSTTVVARPSES